MLGDVDDRYVKWQFLVLVIRRWHVRSKFQIDQIISLDLVLQDKKGDRIHAAIEGDLISTFEDQICEHALCAMKNFEVHKCDPSYRPTLHEWKLVFQKRIRVIEQPLSEWPDFGLYIYYFRPFGDVLKTPKDDTDLFDVVGLITPKECARLGKVLLTSTGKVNFTIEDLDKRQLPVTLWDDYAVEARTKLGSRSNEAILVVLQLYRINFFRLLGVSNSYNVTRLLLNPSIPEVDEFKSRVLHDTDGLSQNASHTTTSSTKLVFDEMEKSRVKSIDQLINSSEVKGSFVVGTVVAILSKANWSYYGCLTDVCAKKLKPNGKEHSSSKCGAVTSSGSWRYTVSLRLKGQAKEAIFTLWVKQGEHLLGFTAGELCNRMAMEMVDPRVCPIVISDLISKKLIFKVGVQSNSSDKRDVYTVDMAVDDASALQKYGAQHAGEICDVDSDNEFERMFSKPS